MILRDYQKECIAAVESHGAGRWLCQLATGMGKTVIFAHLPRRGNTLILSHRQELVNQPLKYFDCPTAVEMAKSHATLFGQPSAPVVSASVQTMTRRKEDYAKDAFDTIIVDEAHHATAGSYRDILDYFTPRRIVGFTATPNRADGVGLEHVFDEIIFERDLKWGIEHGYLSNIICKRVNIGYDLAGVATRMGDYAPGELERVVNTDYCNNAIAEIVRNIADPPVLIFAVDVEHAYSIAQAINRIMPGTAQALSAQSDNREAVVKDYLSGKLQVLVNCALFTEGTDLPNTRTVIIARPTKSSGLYAQMAGRGTRLAQDKPHCLLIDCVGISNMPLCTAPSLLGLDLSGVPAKYHREIEGDLLADLPTLIEHKADTPESWIDNVRQVDLWAQGAGYNLHDVNYIKHADGSLRLRLPVEGTTAACCWMLSAPDLTGKVKLINPGGECEELPAQKAYDKVFAVLRDHYIDSRPLWDLKSARRWGAAPAGEKQINYISRLACRAGRDVADLLPKLTKLQASALIERLRTCGRTTC